ncbi:hypothetical protein BC628DRAFT_1422821 [Trametes gibbosa]|nr:hypothetical protein BC628DRAFT_1422821 [Trametes gibbosa]
MAPSLNARANVMVADTDVNHAIHDTEYWMDDGSIVLVAGGYAFKVYKGILAAQSPVFHDMFLSSAEGKESIDNCAVVHLSDSSEDLRHFLRAIFPLKQFKYYKEKENAKASAEAVFSVVRLAHKYQIDELQRQALACVQEYYTTRFDLWESKGSRDDVSFATSPLPTYAVGAIALARLTDTPSILPLAFYDCYRLGARVLDGWTHEDGSVERLSDRDLRTCLGGARELAHLSALAAARVFAPTPRCGGGCTSLGRTFGPYTHVLNHGAVLDAPLHPFPDDMKQLAELYGVCDACTACFQTRMKAERRAIWSQLPSLFGLVVDGWDS